MYLKTLKVTFIIYYNSFYIYKKIMIYLVKQKTFFLQGHLFKFHQMLNVDQYIIIFRILKFSFKFSISLMLYYL